jgi:hypothetical protein
MSNFTKWTASPFGSKPYRKEYSRETEHFYMHARGRGRDSKVSSYVRYFDTEAEALEHIRQREENKLEQKRVDRIKSAGVELLEALELLMGRLDPHDYPAEQGAARVAIGKARGEA